MVNILQIFDKVLFNHKFIYQAMSKIFVMKT